MFSPSHRLRHTARKLTTSQLQQDSQDGLSLEDLSLFEVGSRGGDRFLGFYSQPGLRLALEKYGFFVALARRGFTNVDIHLDTSDPFLHRLRMEDYGQDHARVLGELVVRRENLVLPLSEAHELSKCHFPMLTIEWLYLQNAQADFNSRRPQLPGQDHPGLGLARMILELLLVVCWRLNLAGLLNHPAHYHNAVMGASVFRFANPQAQARFQALQRDLAGYHLQAASWALEWECVYDQARQEPVVWKPNRYLIAMDHRLKAYFNSLFYLNQVWQTMGDYQFDLHNQKFSAKASQSGIFIPRIKL